MITAIMEMLYISNKMLLEQQLEDLDIKEITSFRPRKTF